MVFVAILQYLVIRAKPLVAEILQSLLHLFQNISLRINDFGCLDDKAFRYFLTKVQKNRNSVLLFKNFYVNLQSQTAPTTCKEGTGRIYIIGVYYA